MPISPQEILIFLGPSLPLNEAQILLNATYLPPAKQGDIISATVSLRPKVIGLIDGTFMQTLSVWHKEIIYALDLGIIMLGSSSMGALRAAETAEFGMLGVGKIFEMYHIGEVTDDDEVALIHGPQEEGYISFSIPLINLRFTLDHALSEERISKKFAEAFFAVAKALYYPDRTLEKISESARNNGFLEEDIKEFTSLLQTNYIDQKKEDACLLLEKIKTLSTSECIQKDEIFKTRYFDIIYNDNRRPHYPSSDISLREIAHYIAVHHPNHSEMQFNAFNQALVEILANLFKVEVSSEEVEQEIRRFRYRHHLTDDQVWSNWFSRNHSTKEEFYSFIKERAKARKLHRIFVNEEYPWKPTKFLLNELKWTNTYEKWSEKALFQEDLFQETAPCYMETDSQELNDTNIVKDHLAETPWNPDLPVEEWAQEAGFCNNIELRMELHKAKLARDYHKSMFDNLD